MSGVLTGREISGTPLETRGGTRAIAGRTLSGGESRDALLDMVLTDPRDALRGLFAAMVPFEERQVEQGVAGLRSGLGRLGGRFGRSAMDAETQLRGEFANQFARSREEALIQANAQILQALLGLRGQELDFFRPGAPNFQEGILGDLLGAGGNIAAMRVGRTPSTAPNPFRR